jgi:hypothetical protein
MTVSELSLRIREVVHPGEDKTQPLCGDCKVKWRSNPDDPGAFVDLTKDQVDYDSETETILLG